MLETLAENLLSLNEIKSSIHDEIEKSEHVWPDTGSVDPGQEFSTYPDKIRYIINDFKQTEGSLTIQELSYADYVSVNSQLSVWPFIKLQVSIVRCTVTFKNESGTVLETKSVALGSAVSYSSTTPTKASTAQYSYTFDYWMQDGTRVDLSDVRSDLVLTPHFKSTLRTYKIRFLNDDGTVLRNTSVAYGSKPTPPATPSKASTAQYTYSFTGWSPSITSVTGAKDYTAQYSASVRSYNISFVVDGVTTTKSFEYGTTPSYGSTPTKEGGYTFIGWSPEIASVTGDATYTAQWRSDINIEGIWQFKENPDLSPRVINVGFKSNGATHSTIKVEV